MTDNKTMKFIAVVASLFIFSFICAIIDNYPLDISAYELGKSTSLQMKLMVKILSMVGLFTFAYRTHKRKMSNTSNIN